MRWIFVRFAPLSAYRYPYIGSGVEHTRFPSVLRELLRDQEQDYVRVLTALAPLL